MNDLRIDDIRRRCGNYTKTNYTYLYYIYLKKNP